MPQATMSAASPGTALPQTLAQMVRAKFPGAYDDLNDAELDAKVRAKFPGAYDDVPKPPPAPSVPSASWLALHPKTAQVATGVADTLPALGGLAGGVATAAGGPGTALAGTALGVGIGRGARDLLMEYSGLAPKTSPISKAGGIALDTAVTAALPGLIEAVKTPVSTVTDLGETFSKVLPEPLKKLLPQLQALKLPPSPYAASMGSLERPAAWGPIAEEVVDKPHFAAIDVLRIRHLISQGLSESTAVKTIIALKTKGLP